MTEAERGVSDDELVRLKAQAKEDRKLIEQAAQVLGELDRGVGLVELHADVLAALRIRLEGKPRASLDQLLSAAGTFAKEKDLGDVLAGAGESSTSDWPVVEDKKRDWPGL